jgi:hypothetical protein
MITASLELKRMELLREAVPAMDELGILANRKNPRFTVDTNVIQTVAAAIGGDPVRRRIASRHRERIRSHAAR